MLRQHEIHDVPGKELHPYNPPVLFSNFPSSRIFYSAIQVLLQQKILSHKGHRQNMTQVFCQISKKVFQNKQQNLNRLNQLWNIREKNLPHS